MHRENTYHSPTRHIIANNIWPDGSDNLVNLYHIRNAVFLPYHEVYS